MDRYTTISCLIAIVLFSHACNSNKHKPKLDSLEYADTTLTVPDSIKIKNAFENIIQEFSKPYVFNDENNLIYFKSLKKIATDSQLLSLTNHVNGNVKGYAFKALYDRNYSGITLLLKKQLSDTQTIYIRERWSEPGGSISYVVEKHLNIYLFKLMLPRLTTQEARLYKQTISKSFTAKEWERINNNPLNPF